MNPLAPIITVIASLLLVWLARAVDSAVLFQLYLALSSIFLVLLVLVQKGRGGGLAGALGGPGGSSAFGAKAGDVFTRITILAAVVWVIFAIGAAMWAKNQGNAFGEGGGSLKRSPASAPAGSSESTGTPATDNTPTSDQPASGPDLGPASGEAVPAEPMAPTGESSQPVSPPADPTP